MLCHGDLKEVMTMIQIRKNNRYTRKQENKFFVTTRTDDEYLQYIVVKKIISI